MALTHMAGWQYIAMMILYKLQYIWNGDKHKNLTWVAKGLQQLLANLSTVNIFCVFYVLDLKTNPLGLHDSECFLPFIFITGAENRALPQGHRCHRPLGSLHIWMEAFVRLLMWVYSWPSFSFSGETSAFLFYITNSFWCRGQKTSRTVLQAGKR